MPGLRSDLNVAQQESLVENLRATIPPLLETLQQNAAALAVLVGKPPERFNARGGGMAAIFAPRVTPGLPSELLNRRPDIRQAEQQLKSANYSVESARAAFFPTIQLTGSLGYQSLALKALLQDPAHGFTRRRRALTQPLFDGGLLLGQFENDKGLQAQYLQAYRKSVISAFSNVEQALIALRQTTEQERIPGGRGEIITPRLHVVGAADERRYRQHGDATSSAADAVHRREFQLAQVQLARLLAVVSLFQALGGGWPPTVPAPAG